jgi:hypothetical protein
LAPSNNEETKKSSDLPDRFCEAKPGRKNKLFSSMICGEKSSMVAEDYEGI